MRKFLYMALSIVTIFAMHSCESEDGGNIDDKDLVYGSDKTMLIETLMSDILPEGEITLHMYYNGTPIVVQAVHSEGDEGSTFTFSEELAQGRYSVQYVEYSTTKSESETLHMGCLLNVGTAVNFIVPTDYDKEQNMFGAGTSSNPYRLNSVYSFEQISANISAEITDTKGVFYAVNNDIYMDASETFTGVCDDISSPFMGNVDGGGYTIYWLKVERDDYNDETCNSVGLFNYVSGAYIQNLNIDAPIMKGHTCVGALVGSVMGDSSGEVIPTTIYNCAVTANGSYNVAEAKVEGQRYVGGLVGQVNTDAQLTMTSCQVGGFSGGLISLDSEATDLATTTGYFGGLIGGGSLSSNISINSSTNNENISVDCGTSLGGLIGCADSLYITSCINNAKITSSSSTLSVGGIVGGASNVVAVASINRGAIKGGDLCGGIIGSTLIDLDSGSYGNFLGSSLINDGEISGSYCVGGICGASQICLSDCYNSANIYSSNDSAGGMVGLSPLLSAINCNNAGNISGYDACGGIVGEVYHYVVGASTNAGDVYCKIGNSPHDTSTENNGAAGGIIGGGGSCGAINYSANYGVIVGASNEHTGGIAGDLGAKETDPDILRMICTDVMCLFCCGVSLGAELSSIKEAEVIVKIIASLDIIIAALEIGDTGYEWYEADHEYNEHMEYMDEFEAELINKSDEYAEDIKGYMDAKIATLKYSGAVTSDDKILGYAYNNISDFKTYLNEGDLLDDYNSSIRNELMSIEANNAKQEMIAEIALAVTKCVLGIAGCVVGGIGAFGEVAKATKKILTATELACAAGEVAIASSEPFLYPNKFNVLSVTQCLNFGQVSGSGIVGYSGELIRITHALSAGKCEDYSIADQCDQGMMVCERYVCVGNDEMKLSKDISNNDSHHAMCYSSDSDKSYYVVASDFKDLSNYEDYDINDSSDPNSMWNMVSGWSFALPFTNKFDKNFTPTTAFAI